MIEHASPAMLRATIEALADDLPARAIKIGMLGRESTIDEVGKCLLRVEGAPKVVCDPVMITTSGARLLDEECCAKVVRDIFPHCALITPNLHEAEALVGRRLASADEVAAGAAELLRSGCAAVLVKGGHAADDGGVAQDYYTDGAVTAWLSCARVPTTHTHGTGCTLSSAIAALLSRGLTTLDAVVLAKAYVTQGLAVAEPLGKGPGPVGHTRWPDDAAAMPWLTTTADDGARRPQFVRCDGAPALLPVLSSSEEVATAAAAGAKDIQLRLKGRLAGAALRSEVKAAQAACAANGARLWVNDDWREAATVGAYGVHVGQGDLDGISRPEIDEMARAGLRLGVSTHSYAELARALALRPSYISLGPVFETRSKDTGFDPQGLARVSEWRDLVPADTPLVAIGGITLENARAVRLAGAEGIAAIGALTRAEGGIPGAVREWGRVWDP